METLNPSVFIVGSSGVGKKTLTSRITGSAPDQEASDCEALILLVDAQREETFREVKEWLAHQAIRPEITLFVRNKSELLRSPDGSVQREAWHDEAQDWCCQQLFEYIEVSAANEAADQLLLLDGDPQGVKRVLEALEAHTWPGLQLKATHDGASSNGGPDVPAARGEVPSTSGEGNTTAAANNTHRQYWARAGEEGHTLGSEQEAGAQSRGQQDEPFDRPALSAPPEGMNGAHQNGHSVVAEAGDGASEDEDELDNFESMLGRMSAVRQQLNGIPDDERRARAAAMAMQMMHSLGLDDDDHDDTSDSD